MDQARRVREGGDGVTEQEYRDMWAAYGKQYKCPNCGCVLAPYEVMACRIRGLETPVCLGCLADALVWLKKYMLPMLETALKMLGEELHRK